MMNFRSRVNRARTGPVSSQSVRAPLGQMTGETTVRKNYMSAMAVSLWAKLRNKPAILGGLTIYAFAFLAPTPGHADVVQYHAQGVVTGITGDTALLPLTGNVGDVLAVDFSFDTDAVDTNTSSNIQGKYPVLSMTVTLGANAPTVVTVPQISTQSAPFSDLWGIQGCLPSCANATHDAIRLNFFLPAGSVQSDALTLPPNPPPAGTSVQFGFFSADFTTGQEAFIVAQLDMLSSPVEDDEITVQATGVVSFIDNSSGLVTSTGVLPAIALGDPMSVVYTLKLDGGPDTRPEVPIIGNYADVVTAMTVTIGDSVVEIPFIEDTFTQFNLQNDIPIGNLFRDQFALSVGPPNSNSIPLSPDFAITGVLESTWRSNSTPVEPYPSDAYDPFPPSLDGSSNRSMSIRFQQRQVNGSLDSDAVFGIFSSLVVVDSDTTPPEALAGANQAIHAGDTVNLDGTGSFDDTTASVDLLYTWSFSLAPPGSTAVLVDPSTANARFVADVPGTFSVDLIVEDEAGNVSDPDTVEVSSENVAPEADAGNDDVIVLGTSVVLDGSGSSDADFDPLSFSWTIASGPAGTAAVLVGQATVSSSLTPDLEGIYTLELVVNDGFEDSAPDSVLVTALTGDDFAEMELMEANDVVNEIPIEDLQAPGHSQSLTNGVSQIINFIQKGQIAQAINKLNDTIEHTDGCPLRGEPDPMGGGSEFAGDWVTDCAEQTALYDLLISTRTALELL